MEEINPGAIMDSVVATPAADFELEKPEVEVVNEECESCSA